MLVVGHHFREERPLHHAHHRGLFLIVGLQGDGKNKNGINKMFEGENSQ